MTTERVPAGASRGALRVIRHGGRRLATTVGLVVGGENDGRTSHLPHRLSLRRRRRQLILTLAASIALVAFEGVRPLTAHAMQDLRRLSDAATTTVDLEAGPLLSLEAVPRLVVGIQDSRAGHELYRVRGAFRLSSGNLAVLNAGSAQVRLFNAAGDLLAAAGRPGDGPGEFRIPSSMWLGHGDGIVVWDEDHGRATFFTGKLEYVRDVTPPRVAGHRVLAGRFEDGSLLFGDVERPMGSDGQIQQIYRVYQRFSPKGDSINAIGRFPWLRMTLMIFRDGAVEGSSPVVFDASTEIAVSQDVVWIGTTKEPQILQIDASGRVRRVIRWKGPSLEVTADHRKAYLVQQAPVEGALTFAENFPTHGQLLADGVGGAWLAEYLPPGAARRRSWYHIDRDGSVLGRVQIDASHEMFSGTPHEVVLLVRDRWGVESVQVFGIKR